MMGGGWETCRKHSHPSKRFKAVTGWPKSSQTQLNTASVWLCCLAWVTPRCSDMQNHWTFEFPQREQDQQEKQATVFCSTRRRDQEDHNPSATLTWMGKHVSGCLSQSLPECSWILSPSPNSSPAPRLFAYSLILPVKHWHGSTQNRSQPNRKHSLLSMPSQLQITFP